MITDEPTWENAPERVFMDPDMKFSEWDKQYIYDVEYIRKDLAKPTVKPLEWRDLSEGHSTACALFNAFYTIKRSRSGKSWMVTLVDRTGSTTLGFSENAEAAKESAQDDYEKRALSVLDDTWTP